MSKAIVQLFCPVEGNTGFAGFISYFTSPARCTNVHESNTDFEFGDPKGNKVSPECFRALNSTVNHQGNLSKHIREEKQHIGIVSLWDCIFGTPRTHSCGSGGKKQTPVSKVQQNAVCLVT